MKNEPLVSIVIPTYNAVSYVREAVDSALAQTYARVEVVVVDDGSTDGTKEILSPYVAQHRIVYFYQENRGLAAARNAGIRGSHGNYIAFLDSDDLFLPRKIEEQIRILQERPEYGVCYSDILHFSDTVPRRFYHHRYSAYYPSGDIFRELLKKQFLNPLTVVVRRDIFDRFGYFDEALRRSEDWDLWLTWSRRRVQFYYLDKVLAYYRVRSFGNLSSVESEPEMKEKNYFIFERIGDSMSDAERWAYSFDGVLARLGAKTAFAYLMTGKKEKALQYAKYHHVPRWQRILIAIFPGWVWRILLQNGRRLKHRILLKKFIQY